MFRLHQPNSLRWAEATFLSAVGDLFFLILSGATASQRPSLEADVHFIVSVAIDKKTQTATLKVMLNDAKISIGVLLVRFFVVFQQTRHLFAFIGKVWLFA